MCIRDRRERVRDSFFYGIETMVTEPTQANHSEQMMRFMLRGLCLPDRLADAVAYIPLQSIESISGPVFSRLKQSAPKVGAVAERGTTVGWQDATQS